MFLIQRNTRIEARYKLGQLRKAKVQDRAMSKAQINEGFRAEKLAIMAPSLIVIGSLIGKARACKR
jgi:hypothetical protein